MTDNDRSRISRKVKTALKYLVPLLFFASLLASFVAVKVLLRTDSHYAALDEIRNTAAIVSREAYTILVSRFTPADEAEFTAAVTEYNNALTDSREILADYEELENLVRLDDYISPVLNGLASSINRYRIEEPGFVSMPLLERRELIRRHGIDEEFSMENFLRLENVIAELTFYLQELSTQHTETVIAISDKISEARVRAIRRVFLAATLFLLGIANLVVIRALTRINQARISESAALYRSEALEDLVHARTEDLEIQNQQLREAGRLLAEREKIIALGQVVSGVAHEVNTPLGICVTATTYLADLVQNTDKELDRKEADDVIKLILENISRASNLVKGFKKVAVDEMDDDCRSFDLAIYLRDDLLPGLRSMLTRSQHKVELTGVESCLVFSYPGSIAQVVINLVMNASIHGYGKTREALIGISLEETESTAVLSVSDDGKGMTEDTRSKIYDPFFTTSREKGGSGLGMMIAYNITVAKLNGSIECISSPGKGTTVRISIPKDSRSPKADSSNQAD